MEVYVILVFRCTFFYFVITALLRIMGKREVGQLGIIDLIVSILIAELAALSIEKFDQTILYTVIPIILLLLAFAWLKFHKWIIVTKPKLSTI